MGFLSLGIDSFIACLAVGCLIDRRRWLPYAALFGLCDSLAFLLGVTLHWEMSDEIASIVGSGALVALGAYLLVVAIVSRKVANTRWVWILPFALTLDNISYGMINGADSVALSFWEQLASSACLALLGVVVSNAFVGVIPKVKNNGALTAGIAGVAAIIAVPVLMAVG
jgi:putative Mn2+ efflux pump MntP